jgi:lysophospholipase L1-like esterase
MPTSTDDESIDSYIGALPQRGTRAPTTDVLGAEQPAYWNAGWREAESNAGSTPARVLVIGDSIMAGQPANQGAAVTQSWLDESFYGYLRDLYLAPTVPEGLTGAFYGLNESILRNANYHMDGVVAPSAPIYFNNGTSPDPINGVGSMVNHNWATNNNGWWWAPTSASTTAWTDNTSWMVTFQPRWTDATRIDVLHNNYFASGSAATSFQYGTAADGSGKVTSAAFAVADATTAYSPNRTTIWTGAAAQQRVYLGGQSVASGWQPHGFVAYRNATKGLHIARMAFTGRTAGEFGKANSGVPSDRIKAIVGGFDGTNYNAIGFPTAPHLLIYALGVNDCNQSLGGVQTSWNGSPARYGAVLRRVVEAGRRARPDMSILVLLPHYVPITYGDNPSFAFNDSWPLYHDAARRIAREYGCAYLSVNARWASTAFARGYQAVDDGHPLAAGYKDMATFVAGVL